MRDLTKEEFEAFVKRMLREAPGDEDELDLETEDEAEEESEEAAAEEEEAEESEEDAEGEEDEEDEDSKEDEVVVTKGSELDKEIQSVLIDFESSALAPVEKNESLIYKNGISLLVEKNMQFSLDAFASDVARLIKNYENLLDMESIILNKSITFVKEKYGEDTAKDLENILSNSHSIDMEEKDPVQAPIAVGASKEGADAS